MRIPSGAGVGERVLLGLGSNLGDREGTIRDALETLDSVPGVVVERTSTLRETRPVATVECGAPQGVGPAGGIGRPAKGSVIEGLPDFLNGVAELRCTIEPRALFAVIKELEARAGRDMTAPRDAPRPLDLDIIAFGARRIDERRVTIPHRALFERPFWLEPMAELGVDLDELRAIAHPARPLRIERAAEMSACVAGWREGGCTVGLVPTMGALHAGHLSLVEAARAQCDRVVVSIFVNPLQFGAGEDLDRYPRPIERDLAMLAEAGVDAAFTPRADDLQPEDFCSRISVGPESAGLEDDQRPGHFSGVATVVAQMFAIVSPHLAYFGEKDAQQLAVVRRMARDLGFTTRVRGCPIVREPDGLAMSSRNVYLQGALRSSATCLHKGLVAARRAHSSGERDAERLCAAARQVLAAEAACVIDYVEIRTWPGLTPWPASQPVDAARLLVAGRFRDENGRETRLLDNIVLGPESSEEGL